ncbi:MAG: hypothetical protein HC828_04210 [Blastochloris sp.]|nr:hypothetical protein [Blastochloris sp.]
MHINLIPCEDGVSHSSSLLIEAIQRFHTQVLAVVIVCSDQYEYTGPVPRPDTITRANIYAAIVLFREPRTIGQVTGFVLEEALNINISGTGGAYGQALLDCLATQGIQPFLLLRETVFETMEDWVPPAECADFPQLPVHIRLAHWENVLINLIIPQLWRTSPFETETGAWQDTWHTDAE